MAPSGICDEGEFICEWVYDWTNSEFLAGASNWLVGKPLEVIAILVGAYLLNRFIRRSIHGLSSRLGDAAVGDSPFLPDGGNDRTKRRLTSISTLLRSATSAIVYSVAAIMILDLLGISVAPLLASAGIAGVAIGFGAQRLVEDVITGLFMLIEDQFGVGDQIDVDMVHGTVEGLTLRSTVLRDADGTLWHIPNSEIRRVANESQLWSRAVVDVGVAYGTPTDHVMSVLARAVSELAADPDWEDNVRNEPEVLGIQELGGDSVNIRVVARVDPGARVRFEREMRKVFMEALDAAELEMPNRQLDVWLRS
ncbi:MAG: mechanosensitive ion channel family protein [Actinomycetia bacterium]|nr:mechanosensitive ion channel family protein [Actinomycetes bacterium]